MVSKQGKKFFSSFTAEFNNQLVETRISYPLQGGCKFMFHFCSSRVKQ